MSPGRRVREVDPRTGGKHRAAPGAHRTTANFTPCTVANHANRSFARCELRGLPPSRLARAHESFMACSLHARRSSLVTMKGDPGHAIIHGAVCVYAAGLGRADSY